MRHLSTTRLATLRRCPRQHYFRYELRLQRIRSSEPLRLGSAFHVGQELHNQGADAESAISQATAGYEPCPEWADPYAWQVECETVRNLLAGHFWRYEREKLEYVAAEREFEIPLVDPQSGKASDEFVLVGKIDAVVRLPDGRLAVLEYKTAGEDIGTASNYWQRLRYDSQISQYVLAARAIGFDVSTVLYDVTRKPATKPQQIPLLDNDGAKIVLDAEGQRVLTARCKPRQTGDAKQGYVLQSRQETPEEYGRRLLDDIADRPDFYFQRREVPRLEDELAEFQVELWQQAEQLRDTQRHGRWFRNVGKLTCNYCEFAVFCLGGVQVDPSHPPSGFEIRPSTSSAKGNTP